MKPVKNARACSADHLARPSDPANVRRRVSSARVTVGSSAIFDHLRDPDDPDLLDPAQAKILAGRVESARLAAGAVRYGRVGRVGVARVVVNRDNPLPSGNHACALDGTAAQVASTMLRLEDTFADLGRAEAVVFASPTTIPEIDGIADDTGWHAAAEEVAVVRREPVAAHPTPTSFPPPRGASDLDLPGIAELCADELGLAGAGLPKLRRHLAHLLDDPRWQLLVLDDAGADRAAGFLCAFTHTDIGLLDHLVLRPSRRRHGGGRSLVHAAVDALRRAGAELVVSHVEEGGGAERFAEDCGFEAAYPVVTYVRRVDELLGER